MTIGPEKKEHPSTCGKKSTVWRAPAQKKKGAPPSHELRKKKEIRKEERECYFKKGKKKNHTKRGVKKTPTQKNASCVRSKKSPKRKVRPIKPGVTRSCFHP